MPSTTTNFGFEYPLATDNLSDGAQSIQDFATTADNTFVDLKGGTTGQHLTKNTNTDMDFVWVSSNDGYPLPGTGYYFGPRNQIGAGSLGTQSLTANYMLLVPFVSPAPTSIDRIAVEVTTLLSGGTMRLGVYDNNGTGGAPSTLIADFGTVSTTTTGIKELTVSATLPIGLCYLAMVSSSGTPVYRSMDLQGSTAQAQFAYQDNTTDAFASSPKWWARASVTGALPNPAGATLTAVATIGFSNDIPMIFMRAV